MSEEKSAKRRHIESGNSGKHVLVTGGAGFIGSHTVTQLVNSGARVTIIDNLSNSNDKVIGRLKKLVEHPEKIHFIKCDLNDSITLEKIFSENVFNGGVIHFAGCKAVGESYKLPLKYYINNLQGSICLFKMMKKYNVKQIVFSSSCTVYGSSPPPLTENATVGEGLTNAYAKTKFMIEQILANIFQADKSWKIAILRYFNPVGAHSSGTLGEDPCGIPTCLMPYVLQVLVERRSQLTIFGDDYSTRDGTCIRDYIHVEDVARGHLDALTWLDTQNSVIDYFNFGTGNGVTVKELVDGLEKASGKKVNSKIGPRREGDLQESFCDPTKAKDVLGWKAKYSLDDMCKHAWKFQSENPNGYT